MIKSVPTVFVLFFSFCLLLSTPLNWREFNWLIDKNFWRSIGLSFVIDWWSFCLPIKCENSFTWFFFILLFYKTFFCERLHFSKLISLKIMVTGALQYWNFMIVLQFAYDTEFHTPQDLNQFKKGHHACQTLLSK